jgi:hypothetical protein
MRLLSISFLLSIITFVSPAELQEIEVNPDAKILNTLLKPNKKIETKRDHTLKSTKSLHDPVIPNGHVLQLPPGVDARSMSIGNYRHAIYITDGAVHGKLPSSSDGVWNSMKKFVSGLFDNEEGEEKVKLTTYPYGYIYSIEGQLLYRMDFSDRTALPYGIAEEVSTGHVTATFYQAQTSNIETWEPNLALKWTSHKVSLKPSIPFWVGPKTQAIPFTVVDRLLEEGDHIGLVMFYDERGNHRETFHRHSYRDLVMVHTVGLDALNRFISAGLTVWPYQDGVHGQLLNETAMELAKQMPTHIDVSYITTDSNEESFKKEQRNRYRMNHQNVTKEETEILTDEQLKENVPNFVLHHIMSYALPISDVCVWPLIQVPAHDGVIIYTCYDSDTIYVFRYAKAGDDTMMYISLQIDATIQKPYGITKIGAISLDHTLSSIAVLDRARQRVYSIQYPFTAEVIERVQLSKGEEGDIGIVQINQGDKITWPTEENSS